MSESSDEVEFRLDMLRSDLELDSKLLKANQKYLGLIEAQIVTTSNNLKYLKSEAQVVSIVDYLSARDGLVRLRDEKRTIAEAIAKGTKRIEATTKEIANTERDLQRLLGSVKSAKILEFPNGNNGRDPASH